MNQQQGRQFVEEVLTNVWQHYNIEKIDDYYTENVQGQINGEVVTMEDIRNNGKYWQQHSSGSSSEVVNVVTHDNQIMARVRQQIMLNSGESESYDLFVNYQLENGKVAQIDAITYPSFDYKHR